MGNVVSTVSRFIDNDGKNILKLIRNLPLCPDFNVAIASRLIQVQNRTLDNNVSSEMSFFCELPIICQLCWVPF